MTNNIIFNSQIFKWVLSFDPDKTPIQWESSKEYASSINGVAQKVIAIIPTLTSKQDQKIVKQFEQKLVVLNERFGLKGNCSLFDQSIEALVLTSSTFERELSPQVASLLKCDDLNELLRAEGDKKTHLKAFLKELHSVLQTGHLNKQDLAVLQKVAEKCYKLSQECKGASIKPLMGSIIDQFKCHTYLQSLLYQNILNYQKGMLQGKDPAIVGQEMTKLANQLAALAQNPDNPIDEKELLQVYENIKVIQQEFLGQRALFTEALNKMQEIPQVKEGMFKRFQMGLQNLDLDSSTLNTDVSKLKQDLRQIYPENDPNLNQLFAYLNELVQPNLLKPSVSEEKLIQWIKTQLPELKDAEYTPHVGQSTRLARAKLLSVVQQNMDSIESLNTAVRKCFPVLKRHTIKYRLNAFLEKNSIKKTHLVNRFPALVDIFDKFTNEVASKIFIEKWDAIKNVCDLKTAGRFSEVVEKVGHLNLGSRISTSLVSAAQNEFLKRLNLSKVDNSSDEKFKTCVIEACQETQEVLPAAFDKYYASKYKKQHAWVIQNIRYIEVAYDQALDIHKNSATGTCFQNSLSRQALLIRSPTISSTELPIGSTEKGRWNNAKTLLNKSLGLNISLSIQEQLKTASSYELEEKNTKVLSEEKPSQKLVDEIIQWARKNKETRLIMTFQSPGHALNIQMDKNRGIYRFMDDNIGYMRSYPDLKTFQSSLTEYLRIFYPKAEDFTLHTYRHKPPSTPTS